MSDKEKKVSPEEAKKALEEEAKKRVDACSKALQATLEENQCSLAVSMLVAEQGNMPQIRVVPVAPKE